MHLVFHQMTKALVLGHQTTFIHKKTKSEHMANQAGSYFSNGGHSANKSIMNKNKVKHHRNSDSKTGNKDHIRTTALERSVINYWGLKLV